MKKFLIEVPHGPDQKACIQAIQVFIDSGSHFLTHADWGCKDGEHKAWIIVETENKEEARTIIPLLFRREAKITQLIRFSANDLRNTELDHLAVDGLA